MTVKRLIAIAVIVVCTSAAWFILATAIGVRSSDAESRLNPELTKNWGPVLTQHHPTPYYEAPAETNAHREIQPERSDITVSLHYEPKNKG